MHIGTGLRQSIASTLSRRTLRERRPRKTETRKKEFNAPDGVRGHKWGSPPSELGEQVTLSEDDGDTKCYSRKEDDLSVGEAQLDSIAYCFYKDRLDAVSMKFQGESNFMALKSAMVQTFGAATQPNQFMQDYTWMSAAVYIDFKYNEISHKGGTMYLYLPITAEAKRDSDLKAKQAADKL